MSRNKINFSNAFNILKLYLRSNSCIRFERVRNYVRVSFVECEKSPSLCPRLYKKYFSFKSGFINRCFVTGAVVGLTSCNSEYQEDVENNLAHLITLARMALERGDIDRAEAILELGLKLSEEHNLHNGIPFIYDILATIALSQGNVVKAETLLVRVVEKLTQLGYSDDSHNIIDFRLRLARIYSASGNNSLANIGFQTCLDQQSAKIIDGDTSERTGLLYVHILFWYGVHKIRNNMYLEARNMIRTAHDYSMKIKGLSPKQEMVILYTLADLNHEVGDFDIALSSIKTAIVLGKGIGSLDMPLCYLKMGNIYEAMGAYEKAREAYVEAKAQAKTFGYGDVETEAEVAIAIIEEKEKKNNR